MSASGLCIGWGANNERSLRGSIVSARTMSGRNFRKFWHIRVSMGPIMSGPEVLAFGQATGGLRW
jgi:hypothetical protein